MKQVEQSIQHSNDEDELNELISLRDSLVEIIELTSECCIPKRTAQQSLEDEYALFKVST